MVIDFHTHTFPDKIASATVEKLGTIGGIKHYTDGTEGALKASMSDAGIDASVVLPVATNPLKVHSVNEKNALMASDSIIHFACMHPLCENASEEMAYIKESGFKGIKLHPVYQGVDINDDRNLRLLELAAKHGLTAVLHCGDDIGFPGKVNCSPEMVAEALKKTAIPHVVLAHMGGWRNWDRVCEALCQTQAYIDTSFSLGTFEVCGKKQQMLTEKQFVDIVRAFGADRVIFGTDSPWRHQSDYLGLVKKLPLTNDELEKILYKNAIKLLN